MFDKLVESSKQQEHGRTGKFFFITGLIYAAMLTAFGVAAVFWFNPGLAEASNDVVLLSVPPPPGPSQAPVQQPDPGGARSGPDVARFITPTATPREIPVATSVLPGRTIVNLGSYVPGSTGIPGGGGNGPGVPGSVAGTGEAPPPPTPSPKPDPTPTPAPRLAQLKVSEGVLQGNAIKKVSPPYPQIARSIHASGAVQVQITISEEGQVIDAVAISGHPVLRSEAVKAARQWLFSPTKLSGVPVQVSGIITFNFTLSQ